MRVGGTDAAVDTPSYVHGRNRYQGASPVYMPESLLQLAGE